MRRLSWVPGRGLSRLLLVLCLAGLREGGGLFAQQSLPNPAALRTALVEALSSSGTFSIAPMNAWGSGDFDALADSFFGYDTPRVSQFRIDMERTASSSYAGGLFFKKLKLKIGADVEVDRNFIGSLDRLMGYIHYDIFELRVESARLKGVATWLGAPQGGMPPASSFDNRLLNVDLLYYAAGKGGISYLGLGYSSYRLPVQLDCLVWDASRDSVWWAPVVSFYQPDMAFRLYSFLFGMDSLHDGLEGRGPLGRIQGLGPWIWTQDRFGAGLSRVSDEARGWIETANGLSLWSVEQIPMLVDYNLTLGLQWVGGVKRLRLGLGLGYNIGGQLLTCITPKGPVETGYVDASPSVYLYHYGPVFEASLSF